MSMPILPTAIAREFEDKAPELYQHSPLYRRLAQHVATDPRLLAIAANAQPGQSPMAMFFAAVHFETLRRTSHPLAAIYRNLAQGRPLDLDPVPHFVDFCLVHEAELRQLISTSRIQTNEPGRAVFVRLGLEWIGLRYGDVIATYIEIGASAGLNLNWERFHMRFERTDGRSWSRGPESSPVHIACTVSGLEFPAESGAQIPLCSERLGLDIEPIDIEHSAAQGWLRAFLWPDDCDRLAGFQGAISLRRENPVPLMKADATCELAEACAGLRSPRILVAHTFLTSQLTPDQRAAMTRQLEDLSADREVFQIGAEWCNRTTELRVRRFHQGHREQDILLATGEPHGRSVRWVHRGS